MEKNYLLPIDHSSIYIVTGVEQKQQRLMQRENT